MNAAKLLELIVGFALKGLLRQRRDYEFKLHMCWIFPPFGWFGRREEIVEMITALSLAIESLDRITVSDEGAAA